MLLCEREGEWRREREAVERESGVCVRGRAAPKLSGAWCLVRVFIWFI
jgi:hypothetical protein